MKTETISDTLPDILKAVEAAVAGLHEEWSNEGRKPSLRNRPSFLYLAENFTPVLAAECRAVIYFNPKLIDALSDRFDSWPDNWAEAAIAIHLEEHADEYWDALCEEHGNARDPEDRLWDLADDS